MNKQDIKVREIQPEDFTRIADYFLNAGDDFLTGMGVDLSRVPSKDEWIKLLAGEFDKKTEDKKAYFMIWLLSGEPVGHSNINKIIYGEEAFMHLHMWKNDNRHRGLGLEFVRKCIPYYFGNFKLKNLFCEPYALNPAPNKTMEKLGFEFIKEYETIPGWLNFRQPVKRWCLTAERFQTLFKD
jgi:RimJ/RimL family protein N-acetyltransferase